MNNFSRILFLSALLLLTSCAVRKEIAAIKTDSAYLRTQVDSLRAEQRRLRQELLKLHALTEQSLDAANRWRADTQVQLNQVAEQTQLLSDRLEDTGRRIANLPAKLRLAVPPPVKPAPDTTAATGSTDSAENQAPASPTHEETQRIYETAYQDLVKGKFDLARQGFMEYLRLQPEGDLADNAHYWLGESYYAQKNYEAAMQEFGVVIEKYPEGDKVPSAMLKLAYSQLTLGKTAAGKENLQALIKRFPQSNEANLAKMRLQELK